MVFDHLAHPPLPASIEAENWWGLSVLHAKAGAV
jgi:hypothetical protein